MNTRLRRKSHVGEFRQFGLTVSFRVPAHWGRDEHQTFAAYVAHWLEQAGLRFVGTTSVPGAPHYRGLVRLTHARRSTSDMDRGRLRVFLCALPVVSHLVLGPPTCDVHADRAACGDDVPRPRPVDLARCRGKTAGVVRR